MHGRDGPGSNSAVASVTTCTRKSCWAGIACGGLDADAGRYAAKHEVADAHAAQHGIEAGSVEGAGACLVDHDVPRVRGQLGDDLGVPSSSTKALTSRMAGTSSFGSRPPSL